MFVNMIEHNDDRYARIIDIYAEFASANGDDLSKKAVLKYLKELMTAKLEYKHG